MSGYPANTTNGYPGRSYVTASRYVTIVKPGAPNFMAAPRAMMLGMPKP